MKPLTIYDLGLTICLRARKSSIVNRRSSIALLLALVLALPAAAAQNTDQAGANAGISLRFSPSARGAALGDAYTAAVEGNVEGLYYNPAGLGWSEKREISAMYQNLVLDVGQGALGYVQPWGGGAWGVLGQYVTYGTTQKTTVDVANGRGANAGTFDGRDISVGLTYGGKWAENWGYGITAKMLSSQIDDADAVAFAADLGMLWRPKDSPLSLGMTVMNIGTSLEYDQMSERLPVLFRAGAAWKPEFLRGLMVTGDVQKIAKEGWTAHGGIEYTLMEMFSLRAGYDGSLDIDNGLTVGAGFKTGGVQLDYAYIPFGKVGNNHRVGLRYRF